MTRKKSIQKTTGTVVRTGEVRTCVVAVQRRIYHARYKKTLVRSRRFLVDDRNQIANIGDTVEFIATKPISKRKSWKINRIIE